MPWVSNRASGWDPDGEQVGKMFSRCIGVGSELGGVRFDAVRDVCDLGCRYPVEVGKLEIVKVRRTERA